MGSAAASTFLLTGSKALAQANAATLLGQIIVVNNATGETYSAVVQQDQATNNLIARAVVQQTSPSIAFKVNVAKEFISDFESQGIKMPTPNTTATSLINVATDPPFTVKLDVKLSLFDETRLEGTLVRVPSGGPGQSLSFVYQDLTVGDPAAGPVVVVVTFLFVLLCLGLVVITSLVNDCVASAIKQCGEGNIKMVTSTFSASFRQACQHTCIIVCR